MSKKVTQHFPAFVKTRYKSPALPFYREAAKTPNHWVMFEIPVTPNHNDVERIQHYLRRRPDAKCLVKTVEETWLLLVKVIR